MFDEKGHHQQGAISQFYTVREVKIKKESTFQDKSVILHFDSKLCLSDYLSREGERELVAENLESDKDVTIAISNIPKLPTS
ncbi:hypothetical protein EG68_07071 [Paragonimus skrjabini miyazakii]|uniref:Uncharacterized protein n=1 Tax=Paragonimus skrjabini miyazakii TaxID=59628 RepID=A0A8S9YL52_9TREM|nr:hypothetical protein EG68_07071 [Paragonimus skrjabini miyazakii]